jgi:hypothetical protein
MMASTLTTIATACVLLRWSERAVGGAAGATFAAWCAVQCFSGAIFAALGVFAALLCAPLLQGNRAMFRRTAWTVAVVVALLQIPHALNAANRATDSVDRADPARLGRMLPIKTEPRLVRGWAGFARAVNSIEASPWNAPWVAWFFVPCAAVVAVKHRQDVSLLSLTLLPPIAAIAGHALFVPNSPDYYDYLSLMPAVVLTFLLALTAVSSPLAARNVAVTAFALSLVLVPFRLRFSQTIRRMPEYGVLLDGSRKIARRGQPVRGIRTEFVLPVTSDSEFLYTLLGGRIDPSSPWVALIKADGEVVYQRIGGV